MKSFFSDYSFARFICANHLKLGRIIGYDFDQQLLFVKLQFIPIHHTRLLKLKALSFVIRQLYSGCLEISVVDSVLYAACIRLDISDDHESEIVDSHLKC